MVVALPDIPYVPDPSDIGEMIGEGIGAVADSIFKKIWDASVAILQAVLGAVDQFAVFEVSKEAGIVGTLWPVMMGVAGILALGLFFFQIARSMLTSLHDGGGIVRAVTGAAQYGIALAVSVGVVAALLAGAHGLTELIFWYGLHEDTFEEAFEHTSLAGATLDAIKPVILGLVGLFGVLPMALIYIVEMLFRQAAVLLLVVTIPITAAGLVSDSTRSWYWRVARWILAAVFMEPALALAITVGVGFVGGAQGLRGLLIGTATLFIALFAPFALFKLFAFVDPQTQPGMAFRDGLSAGIGNAQGFKKGLDDFVGSGDPGSLGQATTDRFDNAHDGVDAPDGDHASGGGSSGGDHGQLPSSGGGTSPSSADADNSSDDVDAATAASSAAAPEVAAAQAAGDAVNDDEDSTGSAPTPSAPTSPDPHPPTSSPTGSDGPADAGAVDGSSGGGGAAPPPPDPPPRSGGGPNAEHHVDQTGPRPHDWSGRDDIDDDEENR